MDPNPELLAALATMIREAAGDAGDGPLVAEWSQVATAHAGRIYVGSQRVPLPADAVDVFRELREQMSDERHGAWFSARLELTSTGAVEFTPNYTERVFWNGTTMLDPPQGEPVPGDAEWTAELRRHPRAPENVPAWITADMPDLGEFTRLRAALEEAGLPRAAVRLPGEDHLTFEGALLVREHGAGAFSIDIFDYGQLHHLGTRTGAGAARELAWTYLTSPLPGVTRMPAADIAERLRAAAPGYDQLLTRLRSAGPGGIVTNLATGVPFDRWGGIDGLYLFAWDTPLPARALPPSATTDGAARVGFLAHQPVPVQAELAPAWFDQPGGGIRFRVNEPLRDLLRTGALSVVVEE